MVFRQKFVQSGKGINRIRTVTKSKQNEIIKNKHIFHRLHCVNVAQKSASIYINELE